jgi:hypothetical protein
MRDYLLTCLLTYGTHTVLGVCKRRFTAPSLVTHTYPSRGSPRVHPPGTHFTSFAGTKVQILTDTYIRQRIPPPPPVTPVRKKKVDDGAGGAGKISYTRETVQEICHRI